MAPSSDLPRVTYLPCANSPGAALTSLPSGRRKPRYRLAVSVLAACTMLVCVAYALAPYFPLGAVHAEEPITLTFAGRYPESAGNLAEGYRLFQQYIKEYEELNPHIRFEYIAEAPGTSWVETLLVRIAAFGMPDIVHLHHSWFSDFFYEDAFQPIPQVLLSRLADALHPATLMSTEVNGANYGIPTEVQVSGLVYNRELLGQIGIASPPGAWGELVELARRLPRTPEGTYQHLPLAVNGGGWGWAGNFLSLLSAEGGSMLSPDGEIALNSAAVINVLANIGDWFGPQGFASDNRSPFLTGEGYFGLGYPWWLGLLRSSGQTDAHVTENFKVTLMPVGTVRRGAYLYGWSLFVAKDSPHADEAWRFLEWLALDRTGRSLTRLDELVGLALGSLPSHREDLASPEFTGFGGFFQGFAANLDYAVTEPILPKGTQIQESIAQAVNSVIRMEQSPAEAAENLNRTVRALAGR